MRCTSAGLFPPLRGDLGEPRSFHAPLLLVSHGTVVVSPRWFVGGRTFLSPWRPFPGAHPFVLRLILLPLHCIWGLRVARRRVSFSHGAGFRLRRSLVAFHGREELWRLAMTSLWSGVVSPF